MKSASEILVNVLGIHYCMCLYINSWSFTKLTSCHDEYNHLWDYRFISQIRSLLAAEPSSDLGLGFFLLHVLIPCTYSGSVSNVALFFLVKR